MKKLKWLFCALLLIISFRVLFVSVNATESTYLEAKDYITLAPGKDNSREIKIFLARCKAANKDAFFNSGTYILGSDVALVSDVSIIGDEMTIFSGQNSDSDYQINIFDDEDTKNITIKNIIFDNVTIYSQNANSINWSIEENIFLNAKKVDIDIDSGLKPDSSNKNGGELTGYYILKSKTNGNISSNLFLRDSTSKGRGIGLYNTYDFTVKDNYFGLIEDIDDSIVSEKVKSLKDKVLKLESYTSDSNQGYFMTCINVISGDSNVLIEGNHFSINKDIEEAYYENGSGQTSGYNRDHIIYAKEYDNLQVVGNYFKGSNKNQDGGLKIRNGSNALVYRNIFEDSILLFYVQDYSKNSNLINTYAAENIFVNQDYTNQKITLQPGNLAKYPTQSFLIYVQNYKTNANISNLTIENNKVISLNLPNETVRIVRKAGDKTPQNLNILNNTNYLGSALSINNDYGTSVSTDKFVWSDLERYASIDLANLYSLPKADIKIVNRKIVSTSDDIYINNTAYNNQELNLDTNYEVITSNKEITEIVVEDYTLNIPTYRYAISKFGYQSNYNITTKIYDEIDISDYLDLSLFDSVDINTADFEIVKTNETIILKPKSIGNKIVVMNCGGFIINLNIVVDDGIIDDYQISDMSINLGDSQKLVINYPQDYRVDFSFNYLSGYITIDNNQNVWALKPGIHSIMVTENYSGIVKYVKVTVNAKNVVNLEKEILEGTSFNLPSTISLSSNLDVEYDDTKLTFNGSNQVTALMAGTHYLTIFDKTNNLIINYQINVKSKVLQNIDSYFNIKLGEESKILAESLSLIDTSLEFYYDNSALNIDENSYSIVGLKVGLHGITIRDKLTGLIKNITINVINN